jgi:hypothetical protein
MIPRMKPKTRKVRNRSIARNKAKAKAKASRKPAKAKSRTPRKPRPRSRISKKPIAPRAPETRARKINRQNRGNQEWQELSALEPKGGSKAPPAEPGEKLLKMPNRVPGTKSDFNLRFATSDDYQLVKIEATGRGMSMNLFITTAALKAAGKKAEAA